MLIGMLLISCSSSKNKMIKKDSPNYTPGTCTIIGKIISIDKTKLSKDKNSPCSKQPCWATVKINSVIGCGAGAPFIGNKDTVTVKFAFTLGETTKELFPNLEERMPGLHVNSIFEAQISRLKTLNFAAENKEDMYEIYTYKLVSQIK